MKFGLQASMAMLGLCALAACACGTKLTDYVDSKLLEDHYSDQRQLVAELVQAKGSNGPATSLKFIKQLHGDLSEIHDELQSLEYHRPQGSYYGPDSDDEYSDYDDESDDDGAEHDPSWSYLGHYEETFNEWMSYLKPEVAGRFERLRKQMTNTWFDELREYLHVLESIARGRHGCSARMWIYYAQTVNSIYGHDLDAFLEGKSKLYPRFQAFLLRYGKPALKGCVENGDVFGHRQGPEIRMDSVIGDYRGENLNLWRVSLYELAKGLDLVNGKFDSKKMLAAEGTFDKFYANLKSMCNSNERDNVSTSPVAMLARLFIPGIDVRSGLGWSERAMKLKEYERIYSSFCSASKEAVAANFKRNKPGLFSG